MKLDEIEKVGKRCQEPFVKIPLEIFAIIHREVGGSINKLV